MKLLVVLVNVIIIATKSGVMINEYRGEEKKKFLNQLRFASLEERLNTFYCDSYSSRCYSLYKESQNKNCIGSNCKA